MRDARDTSREARQGARDTARDTREYGRDLRRDSREEWQDTRRDARDARRDVRQESDWRSDFRDDARDFARDAAGEAAEYGRRTAREAFDTARDENWRNRDAGREWNEYGRETGRQWQEYADDTIRDSRDFARDDDRSRDRDDDRDSLNRRDSFRDSRDEFARDSYRDRDDAQSRSRDSFRDTRDDYRTDRDTRFAGERRRDARDTRISRSQIDNFRATSVSARDLGLSLARTSRGLVVDDVRAGALAATIGLRPNDRIVAVEDYRVTSEDQFVRYLFDEDWRHDRVSVIVVRDGREVPIYVRPVQLIERLVVREDSDPIATFGIVLDDRYDDELVIRQVWPNSVAYRAGLRPGDVIVRFHGQRLTSPRQFVQVFNRVDARQAPIVVERDRNLREFVVNIPSNPRMSSGQRTTYRRQLDDGRFGRDQGAQIQYGGEVYQDTYGAPSGVITTQPGQPVFPGQFQPAQPVQSPTQLEDRSDRPGILPRLFGR
jgi:C-terminal processing protease CtpA/Prc